MSGCTENNGNVRLYGDTIFTLPIAMVGLSVTVPTDQYPEKSSLWHA